MATELKIKTTIETGEATTSVKALTDQIKEVDAALQSVSKDSKAYDELSAKSKKLKGDLDGVAKSINSQSAEPIENLSKATGSWGNAVSDIASKIPGLSAAQKALNLVMEANPIGLIIAALTALGGILSQNAELMDEISFIFAGFNKVVRKVADDIVEFGKGFVEALKNPKQALIDFGNFIQNNLINRIKGFGDIVSAIANRDLSALSTALVQVGTGFDAQQQQNIANYASNLADVGKEGYDAAAALDALVEANGALLPALAKTTAEIERQKTILADRTKTDQERIAAAEKIIQLETLNAQRRAKIAQDEFNAEKLKTQGVKLSGEERAALYEKEAKVIEAVSGVEAATRRAQVQLEVLKQSITDEAAAKAKADQEKLDKQTAADLKLAEQTKSAQAKLTEILYEAEKARQLAIAQLAVDTADTPEAKLEAQRALAALELEQTKSDLNQKREATLLDLQQQVLDGLLTKEEFNAAKIALDQTYADQKAEIDAASNAKEIENAKATAAEEKKLKEDTRDASFAIAASGLNAVQSLTNLVFEQQRARVKKGSKEDIEIQRKAFKANKALQIVNAGISTAQAVIAAYAAGSATGGPAGVVLGPVMAAIAGAAGAIQIAAIASKQFNPEGGSTGDSGGGAIPSASAGAGAVAALPSVASSTGVQFDPQSIINGSGRSGQGAEPIKVYVTETDITATQQKVSVIQQRSTYP